MFTHVNSLLDEDMPDDRFVTAFLGALHPTANALAYVTAGQHPLIHYHRATGKAEILTEGDVPLAVLSGHEYDLSGKVDFAPGDIFCLLTDGFHEWANPSGEEFGLDRLVQVIEQNAELAPAELIHKIHREVVDYSNGTRQADDLTARDMNVDIGQRPDAAEAMAQAFNREHDATVAIVCAATGPPIRRAVRAGG